MTNEIKKNEIKKEALKTNIHEYTINNRQEGYDILAQNGININNRSNYYNRYSMNCSGDNYTLYNFNKTNHENVDFIYCVNRDNKSYSTYQTLDYYQNQPDTISDLYIFYKSDSWFKAEQEWLAKQPDIEIKTYKVYDREEAYEILEAEGIYLDRSKFVNEEADEIEDYDPDEDDSIEPDEFTMNSSGSDEIYYNFDKTGHRDIEFIYCVERDNPWGIYYSTNETLDYYKNNKMAIKTIYIFKT